MTTSSHTDSTSIPFSPAAPPLAPPLTLGHVVIATALGIAFWLMGALSIRYGLPARLFDGVSRLAMFALAIPALWLVIERVRSVASSLPSPFVPIVLIVTGVALLCDVVALTWAPGLYAPDAAGVLSGVIWILWGVGWGLAFACWRLIATRTA